MLMTFGVMNEVWELCTTVCKSLPFLWAAFCALSFRWQAPATCILLSDDDGDLGVEKPSLPSERLGKLLGLLGLLALTHVFTSIGCVGTRNPKMFDCLLAAPGDKELQVELDSGVLTSSEQNALRKAKRKENREKKEGGENTSSRKARTKAKGKRARKDRRTRNSSECEQSKADGVVGPDGKVQVNKRRRIDARFVSLPPPKPEKAARKPRATLTPEEKKWRDDMKENLVCAKSQIWVQYIL